MRVKFNPFIKFCATRTVPSIGTESMGLASDAHGVMVFAPDSYRELSRLFHRDPGLTILTRTWYRLDSFIVTRDFSAICKDLQKPRHRNADGNAPNRRAVSGNNQRITETLYQDNFVLRDSLPTR